MQMGMFTKDNGSMIKLMERENIFIETALLMKVFFIIIVKIIKLNLKKKKYYT